MDNLRVEAACPRRFRRQGCASQRVLRYLPGYATTARTSGCVSCHGVHGDREGLGVTEIVCSSLGPPQEAACRD